MATLGIGGIKNIEYDKIFAFKSLNLEKQFEIYKNQLQLNIHHNKKLQKDWNNLGSECFEFIIIEEIYDDFYLDDEFVDYVSLLENNYNEFDISNFSFEYLGDSCLFILYELIGKEECNPDFLNKLKSNGLPEEEYYDIKDEMISLIENDFIDSDKIEETLNEIIQEKSHQIRIFNLDMQYKLMNELEENVGIAELNEEFISKLSNNGLSNQSGFKMKEKIMELIFSNNVIDNNIEKQINSCIDVLKERYSQENKEILLENANNLENNDNFMNKLEESNLSSHIGSKIITQLKELILSDIVTEDTFSQKVDELISIEVDNQWNKNKQELYEYCDKIISSNDFKQKLESNFINPAILPTVKEFIKNGIDNKEIINKQELDENIEKYINKEIMRNNKLKEELLLYLNMEYGDNNLSESFKIKLDAAQLSIDDGKEFILQLSHDISSFKIKSKEDININVDELILNKNKTILTNQLYNLIGKEKNNESFSKKLKLNYLTEEDGNIIRKDLSNLINDKNDIDDLIDLRNNIELELDEMVEIKGQQNYNNLIKLSNELINSVIDIIGDKKINNSFKEKLFSNNLGEECGLLIKGELINLIKKDDPKLNFELKMNQLIDLQNKGMGVVVDEILIKKATIRSNEYKILKNDLINQLNDLIGSENNTSYFDELLIETNIGNNASQNIREYFDRIVKSDDVYDTDNFNYKYEELLFIKDKTINKLLLELIKEEKNIYTKKLSSVRSYLINELNKIIGKDSVIESFRKRLYSYQLSLDYAEIIKENLKEFINSENIYDNQFKSKLDELMFFKTNSIDLKINELIDEESQIKLNELNKLKKQLIFKLNTITDDIKFKENLKLNNLNSEIGSEIKNEIIFLINSDDIVDSKFNYKLEELIELDKKTVDFKINELIEKYSLIYDKDLADIRKTLHKYVDSIIGKNKINMEFKEKLNKNNLPESFANDIKRKIFDFIDSDDVFNKKYEFKLDELKEYSFEDLDFEINEMINQESLKKELLLKDIRLDLNQNLNNLIGEKNNNDYYNNLLKSNNLNSKTGNLIRSELSALINSNNIYDNNYEFKLDELTNLMHIGIDKKLSQIIDIKINEYNIQLDNTRKILLENLENCCEDISFKNKLKLNRLSYDYKDKFKNEIKDIICSNQPIDNKFEVKLDELIDLKNKSVEFKLNELINREHEIKVQELKTIKEKLILDLNELIGENENTVYYDNLLKSNNLNSEISNKIRLEIYNLINSENVIDNNFEFKLDELISLNQKGLKNYLTDIINREKNEYDKNLKDIREKLLNSLESITSKESFKENLYIKQIDETFIEIINSNLTKIISSNTPCDANFEVKLDELLFIDEKGIKTNIDKLIIEEAEVRQNELKQLRLDLLDKLYSIIGKDKNSLLFKYKLINNNLNNYIGNNIRNELIELISSEKCIDTSFKYKLAELKHLYDKGVENKLDELVKRESKLYEKTLNEIRERLIDSTNETIGKNNINISFKNKIKSLGLEEDFADEIKQKLIDYINSDEVSNVDFNFKLEELQDLENNGINTKIDELINNELQRKLSILKENQLKQLYHITGDIPLTETFIEKLNNANFDKEFGIEIIKHFESEIASSSLEEGFDFENAIDDYIFDESRTILLDQTYDIIGKKSNSEYYTNILKENMITQKMGENIRFELISMINEADLKALVDLRKVTMENKFNEIIQREHNLRINKINELRETLLLDLNKYILSYKFKNKLTNNNLGNNFIEDIKNEVENFIESDDIEGDYEFKVDELNEFYEMGVNSKIDEIIERESIKINKEFKIIKNSLLNDLDNYIKPSSVPLNFSNIELKKRNLSKSTGILAYNELYDLISNNSINNSSKYSTKFEELDDLKNKTVKTKFIEILDEYSEKQHQLITFLHSQTSKTSEFNKKLRKMNLYRSFVNNLVIDIENKIKDNKFTKESEITNYLNDYLENEAFEQSEALTKLHDKIGKKGISLKFRAVLMINGLSSDDGKILAQNVEDKIRLNGLRVYDVDDEIERQLKELSNSKKEKVNYTSNKQQKFVFCTQCGHKNLNDSNFCEECGEKLSKL